jgi:ubiquitin C-terminal hydrolase
MNGNSKNDQHSTKSGSSTGHHVVVGDGKTDLKGRKSSLSDLNQTKIKLTSLSQGKETGIDPKSFKEILAEDGAKYRSVDIAQLGNASAKEKQAIEELSLQRWRENLSKNQSILTDTIMGQYLSKLECTVCQTASYNFEPFYILELPIPAGVDQITLPDLLEYSAKPDLLEEFIWDCPKCKKGRPVTKTNYIYKLPPILAVCFKRFEISEDGTLQKNNCLITTQLSGEDMCKYEKGCSTNTSKIYLPYMIVVSCGQIASSWRSRGRPLQLHLL